MSGNYYLRELYPLQNEALQTIAQADTMFYLTGGTALSRHYLQHRYSDDLDFFLNRAQDFSHQAERCLDKLKEKYKDNFTETLIGDAFIRCFVSRKNIQLKIEFINDVSFRVGTPQYTALFPKTDTIENILSNKICALSREEAKDWADIWFISQNFSFTWEDAIENAKKKDTWVDETEVLIKLETFDLNKLNEVKWIKPFDIQKAKKDSAIILKDVLMGTENSLISYRH